MAFESRREDLLAALSWAYEAEETELAVRLAAALSGFWYYRGYLQEAKSWIETILAGRHDVRPDVIARLLRRGSMIADRQGDYHEARTLGEECLRIWRKLGDDEEAADALVGLAAVAAHQGEEKRARDLNEEAVELFKEAGAEASAGAALNNLGDLALRTGDPARATQLCHESLALFRREERAWGMAISLLISASQSASSGMVVRP